MNATPSHNADAEAKLVGAAMWSTDAYRAAADIVDADDFYQPRHAALWAVIGDLIGEGLPADPVLVHERLSAAGRLAAVGAPYLAEVYSAGGTGADLFADRLAHVVAEHAARRRLEQLGQRILQRAQEGATDATDIAVWAAEQLAATRDAGKRVRSLALPYADWFARVPEQRSMVIPGMLGEGDRLVLTGHGGLGKSTLLMQTVVCAAAGLPPLDWMTQDPYEPVPSMILDFENPEHRVKTRIWPMVQDCLQMGADPRPMLTMPETSGNPFNLLDRSNVTSLLRTVEKYQPKLLYIGPVYKLHNGDPDKELTVKQITDALDQVRALGVSIITEAHHTKSGKQGGSLEPAGSNLWTWWPEFGMGLRLQPGDEAEEMHRCSLERWRIDRDASDWPHDVESSGKSGLLWHRSAAPGYTGPTYVEPEADASGW